MQRVMMLMIGWTPEQIAVWWKMPVCLRYLIWVGEGSACQTMYTGRIMMTALTSGIGVTFYSQYADADVYYRLRRYGPGGAFHIAPHGTNISGGATNTGVVPSSDVWYWFKVQVEDTGTHTEIRAKVWAEGSAEPADWQADCYDESLTRLTAGTIGVWSYSAGSKYWDDLAVKLF